MSKDEPLPLGTIKYVVAREAIPGSIGLGVMPAAHRFDRLEDAFDCARSLGIDKVQSVKSLGGRNAALVQTFTVPAKRLQRMQPPEAQGANNAPLLDTYAEEQP